MASSGFTPISLYHSSTLGQAPVAGNLAFGELAINIRDGKLYYKNNSGVVTVIAQASGISAGSDTQVQYNNAGALAGSAAMTFSSSKLTLTNDASIAGMTVGRGNSSVASNTAVGADALRVNAAGGNSNTAIGFNAGYSNTTGDQLTILGYQAGYSTVSDLGGTFIGYQSGYSLNGGGSGNYNIGIGFQAMYGAVSATGYNNVGIGKYSLYDLTSGYQNCAVGNNTGESITTGNSNVFIGFNSSTLTSTGNSNTAIGVDTLAANISGGNNVAVGALALNSLTSSSNTAVGSSAGLSLTNATTNAFFGTSSGASVTTGSNNTIIGSYNGNQGGLDIRTSSNNIVLSDGASNIAARWQNGGGWFQLNNSASWSTTSDVRVKENIKDVTNGLATILALRPVEFDYIITKQHDVGFIAQEYQEILPDQINQDSNISDEIKELTNGDPVLGIQQNLVPYLVKAIQELKAEIEALKAAK